MSLTFEINNNMFDINIYIYLYIYENLIYL